jgi:O-antigen/teichoic acid export membrane protein
MKKEYILYSLAIGINRGATLLYLPFLTYSLSLADYGLYSYIQVLLQVLFPILCFNIPSGIAREGADSPVKGLIVYQKALPYVLGLVAISSVLAFFIEEVFTVEWLLVLFLLAGVEALHNMQLSIYRAFDKHLTYLTYVSIKTIGLGLIISVLIYYGYMSLMTVLVSQVIWYFFVFLVFTVSKNLKERLKFEEIFDYKPIIIFSLLLIPHIVSQWAMSAINRVIVKNLLGNEAMGLYSIIYSLAMVILLINSGIGIVFPQNFIRNTKYWLKTSVRAYFSMIYSFVVVLAYFLLVGVLFIDIKYFNFFKITDYNVIYYFAILSSAFLLLGFYFYYVNILFYHKKSKTISFVTFVTAFYSIIMSYFLTLYFGLEGAAYSTLITYVVYLLLMAYAAKKIESKLQLRWKFDFFIPVVSVFIIVLSGLFFSGIF